MSTIASSGGSAARRNRPLWEIGLYAVAFVAVLWLLGGWPVPFVIFAIILMVVLHEAGHYVTARMTGMKASEFFVGFGPRLWSRTKGETEYGIKAIWIGGYVRIVGMTMLEDVDPKDEPRSYRQATFPRRVLVASAGSLVHLLLALVLAWGAIMAIGQVVWDHAEIAQLAAWPGGKATPAQLAGLRANDEILRINGRPIDGYTQLQSVVQSSVGKTLTLAVLRSGHVVTLHVTPEPCASCQASAGDPPTPKLGFIGVDLTNVAVTHQVPLLNSVPDAFGYLGSTIKAIGVGMYHVFSPAGLSAIGHADVSSTYANSSKFTDNYRPTSIYGIAKWAIQLAQQSPPELLIIFMVINLSIGLLNMLPMLPLDGGHVAVAIYERVRSRKGRPAYHADVAKLTPVVYVFVFLLVLLAASSLYLDIAHPINF